jgi:protein-arginine kinase activator protein McsA
VRVLKPSMATGEPIHRLCAKCYEDGKKSILQSIGKIHGQETLNCHNGGARTVVGVYQAPPP